jgi:hypothetical protein
MSVSSIVTKPDGNTDRVRPRRTSLRSDSSWLVMKPTGTILKRFAAFSSRRSARSRQRSSSKPT